MRIKYFVLAYLLVSGSCNNRDAINTKPIDGSLTDSIDTSDNSIKKGIIQQLGEFKRSLFLKDREGVAVYFQFPIPDSILTIELADSSLSKEYTANNNLLTRDIFVKFFPELYNQIELNQLNLLFSKLDIDSLVFKDTIEKEFRDKNEPCFKVYRISLEDRYLTLEYRSEFNVEYIGKDTASEDSDLCEYASLWIFVYDGKKLLFTRKLSAG